MNPLTAKSDIPKHLPWIMTGVWFAFLVCLAQFSMNAAGGDLFYSLDDPYIHLSVAENILRGGYGINTGEYSTPSSSIIYPYLLAITEWLGFGLWGPLLINVLAMGAAVYLVGVVLRDHVFSESHSKVAISPTYQLALSVAICLLMNSWGLPMTGMEHSLHVLAVVIVVWGLIRIVDGQCGAYTLVFLVAAIVALPLIRFEGMAQCLVSIAALLYLGKKRAAVVTIILVSSALVTWYLFTVLAQLPVLPSSVLTKSMIASNAFGDGSLLGVVNTLYRYLLGTFGSGQGILLLLMLALLSLLAFLSWRGGDRPVAVVIGCVALLAGLGHVFFGDYGWLSRYEVYVFVLSGLSILILVRSYLHRRWLRLFALIAVCVVSENFFWDTIRTPFGARNVFQQQYQMHRFATQYWKEDVAVHDIGWVSYRNEDYVLDIWGLASEDARRSRNYGQLLDTGSLEKLVDGRQIGLVMIYDGCCVGDMPGSWEKVATLHTPRMTSAGDQVSFYATGVSSSRRLHSLLAPFSATLPDGAELVYSNPLQVNGPHF